MPLLLYPLLSMTLQRFLFSARAAGDLVYRIAVIGEAEANLLRALIDDPLSQPPEVLLRANDSQLAQFELVAHESLKPEQLLSEKLVDVAAYVKAGEANQPPTIELWADSSQPASIAARRILVERVQWLKLGVATERLAVTDPGQSDFAPKVELQTIGSDSGTSMLATLVPLVLVLMTITGAVYPAIDLTAGERERGTIEALIASPVPRGQVLFAKYSAVVTVALLTAIVNLVAMLITLKAGGMTVIEPELALWRKPVLDTVPARFEARWGKGNFEALGAL
jgi:ABC-2 type transport system permease protein/sodium transport system permease protein